MSTTEVQAATIQPGGGFLLGETPATFTPEDFTEEQRQIAATASRFMADEVLPVRAEFEQQQPGLARTLMQKAGQLGLLAVRVPEKHGGLEMDMVTAQVVTENLGSYASFSTTFGAHTHIGTLPLVYFGTEEQKQRYLPRLITAEWLAAYCLSEAQAGSDALAARTRAELSPDGKHHILNGEKMWISNGGWADLYTVFAKVDGDKFTAFLVERTMDGVRPGAEEHKMGIKGSSTTPLVLDNVAVPVENVLGEVGRGHVIAFNILNIGRLELAASCVGGGKTILADAIAYAKQRKAFGHAIADFGLIQHKLAAMAERLFANECLVYRTAGLIDERLGPEHKADASWVVEDAARQRLAAVEEYAIECAVAKIYGSEAYDFIVDEGVQIHGGYGYHQDYNIERAYRDSRINRIFEGTNEINRLLTAGMLFKRAAQGRLDLLRGVGEATAAAAAGSLPSLEAQGPLALDKQSLQRAKQATLLVAGAAYQRFGAELEQQQEISGAISDMVMAIYAAESALLRTEKLQSSGRGEQAFDMTRVLVFDAMREIQNRGLAVLAAAAENDTTLDQQAHALHRLTSVTPLNTIELRRNIATRLLTAEKFVV